MGCGSSSQSMPSNNMEANTTGGRDDHAHIGASAAAAAASSSAGPAGTRAPAPSPPPPPQPPAPGLEGLSTPSSAGESKAPKLERKPSLLEPILPSSPAPLNLKSTKIVATLGPSSTAPAMLESLMKAGVNVFRLNFSHSSEHTETINNIRRISSDLGKHTAILADLQGPKFRTGSTADGKPIDVVNGQRLALVTGQFQKVMDSKTITTGTPDAHVCVRELKVGMRVLINDGAVVLRVTARKSTDELEVEVLVGGPIGCKKGINTPELAVPVPALTDKDEKDAIIAVQQDVDFIALSFVQRASDVAKLRDLIAKHLPAGRVTPHIIAKIEKPSALDAIDSILEVVDGIMVARGDMGVECSLEKVPTFQKFLIRKANAVRKPVITATQMLESMIKSPSPTRAEVSDVFNAVLDGTDAVMLSGESAMGDYPLQAVQMMASIVLEAEATMRVQQLSPPKIIQSSRFDLTIADSAVYSAYDLNSAAIVAVCKTPHFALYMSKARPLCPIIVLCFSVKVASLLELSFGCQTVVLGEEKGVVYGADGRKKAAATFSSSDAFLLAAEKSIRDAEFMKLDDNYIFCCADAPLPSMTNTLQLLRFGHIREMLEKPSVVTHTDWHGAEGAAMSPLAAEHRAAHDAAAAAALAQGIIVASAPTAGGATIALVSLPPTTAGPDAAAPAVAPAST